MHHITVSVLLSVYNTAFSLTKRAIDSVLVQDMRQFELLVIDDGSDPAHAEQLQQYVQGLGHQVRYLYHKNCGQAASINRGIVESQGAYITILDADDEYKPNHLSACLQEMKQADLIASTTETIVDQDENYYVPNRHDLQQMIHVDDCILFATLFGKRTVFTNLHFQDQYAADADFFDRAASTYQVRKVDLRTYIYYRNIPTSTCSVIKIQQQQLVT